MRPKDCVECEFYGSCNAAMGTPNCFFYPEEKNMERNEIRLFKFLKNLFSKIL